MRGCVVQLPDRDQRKTLFAGFKVLLAFACFYLIIFLGGFLPKPVGIFFGIVRGWLVTPLIMEPILFILAVFAILFLNEHRRRLEGPEGVEMEIPDNVKLAGVPAGSSQGLAQPPSGTELVATIEGAFELGDERMVNRLLVELPPELKESEEIVVLKLRLAMRRRDQNHVRGLTRQLRKLNPRHPLLG